ncbi:MAG: type II secretion system F family protein [Candidatus Scalinduaceae bacterium]
MFVSIAISVALILIIGVIFLIIIKIRKSESDIIRSRIKTLSTYADKNKTIDITRKSRPLSSIPWLNRIFCSIPSLRKIDHLLEQSNSRYPLGVFILTSFVMVFTGFIVVSNVMNNYMLALIVAGVFGMMPYYYISMKKNRNIQRFQEQLPEALDMMARSVKAGHAFSGALRIVAQEFDNPMGGEFNKVIDEINFGVSIKDALIRLTERVDCDDLKFFAVTVSIQMETGGNLAEVLESIGRIIRDRFKLQRRIRTLSAEGKLSAAILVAIPFFVAFALVFINPDYIRTLITDFFGKIAIALSLFIMIVGIAVMKKIVTIKV